MSKMIAKVGLLVATQRFGGKEEERSGALVGRERVKHRQRIAEALAGRGRRRHDNMLARRSELECTRLVIVEPIDPASR